MSSWDDFHPYVPVAKRRAQAAREVEKLKKKRAVSPVVIEGRQITQSFWGKAWCGNLERYSDFASRLPRGRTYVRNGSVIDLQIERGRLRALVSGSEIYQVDISIAVTRPARWKAICGDCAGSVGSLIELLQGKLSTNVMERVCRESDGLFPAPGEIKLSCSCPDSADMCKHVAAVLYGVGARLDASPELLFALRGVDHAELVSAAGTDARMTQVGAASERVLSGVDVSALFGLDMAAPSAQPTTNQGTELAVPSRRRRTPVPATPAAKEAKRSDLAVLTRDDRAGSKGPATGGEAAVARKTSAAARKAPKVPASPGKGSKAAIDDGSRRPAVTRAGRTKSAKRTGVRTGKARG
jgi:uncharacterized Zn finger protein